MAAATLPARHAGPNGRNWLLHDLPERETAWLDTVLKPARYTPREFLFRAGARINSAYLPATGRVGLVSELADGTLCSVAGVGPRGIAGLSVIGGLNAATHAAMAMTPTAGHVLRPDDLSQALKRTDEFAARILRFQHVLMTNVAQVAFCNRHHEVQHQLCRWLLTEVNCNPPGTPIAITQSAISEFLGVRRESVTLAARKLQALGAIEYRRASVSVKDASVLEAYACECFYILRAQYDALLSMHEPVGAFAKP